VTEVHGFITWHALFAVLFNLCSDTLLEVLDRTSTGVMYCILLLCREETGILAIETGIGGVTGTEEGIRCS
jgi:hypothetical protein